ncbi:RimK/LysX family protein [Vibrio sp. SCSIO 43136]|uniref:ATP-dependent zinc protease family protein n=1 Tax=Vibrio sp. SCSIO 43136 TaxID=2819101 RepID=UPI002075AD75|nr:RimK/LysX family protein [Vibrio sp. SCSIO 43136]USD65169.1 ATP-dependent zinc protease [Vibrio sp. SCSIO 43136]
MKSCYWAIAALAIGSFGSLPAMSTDFTTSAPAYEFEDKLVLGRTESVFYSAIPELAKVPFAAKVDTGADTTSIHAEDVHVFSTHPKYKGMSDVPLMKQIVDDLGAFEEGSEWRMPYDTAPSRDIRGVVQFTMRNPVTGEKVKIERPLARMSVIRSRTSEEPIYRPVVDIEMTIAGNKVKTPVNLTNRSQFTAPILIGKTLLSDYAWVMAGYDYLQGQRHATVIGRSEQSKVDGIAVNISLSQSSNYSVLNAKNVEVDGDWVSFDFIGKDDQIKAMRQPLVRMLSLSGNKRPLVYVPLSIGDKQSAPVLVYLDDRSKSSSQLRLGLRTQSELFITDMGSKDRLNKGAQTFSKWHEKNPALMVSPQEFLMLDDVKLQAEPSLLLKTSLLKLPEYQYDEKKNEVHYLLDNRKVTKPVKQVLKIGDDRRPVVEGEFRYGEQKVWRSFALDLLDQDEPQTPRFEIGRSFSRNGVAINTRALDLLNPQPVFKAGYIEQAEVEGLSFPVKLDTGADMSSISAENIERFEQDGVEMVKFLYRNDEGDKVEMTKPVVDEIRVTAKAGEKNFSRPVIELRVRVGKVRETIKVNLKDRSRFRYSMILGKNFLRHGVLVSSDEQFLLSEKPSK